MLCAHPDNFSLGLSNAQIKHAVSKCVADALKPLYANGKLGKEDYKWVARKSVHKILEQTLLQGAACQSWIVLRIAWTTLLVLRQEHIQS